MCTWSMYLIWITVTLNPASRYQNCVSLCIFCPLWVVNHTGLPLVYKADQTQALAAGQSTISNVNKSPSHLLRTVHGNCITAKSPYNPRVPKTARILRWYFYQKFVLLQRGYHVRFLVRPEWASGNDVVQGTQFRYQPFSYSFRHLRGECSTLYPLKLNIGIARKIAKIQNIAWLPR